MTLRRTIVIYPFALFAAWVGAWAINLSVRPLAGWGPEADTLYWIGLKLLVWVMPVVLLIRHLERGPAARFLALHDPGRGLLWGLGLGAALAAVTFLGRTLPSNTALHTPALEMSLLNAVVVAPLVEEITMRGFLIKGLELGGHPFWRANALSTVAFVAMHVPGWFFQGRVTTLAAVAELVAPLIVLSLLFGWTRKRSGTLYAAIVLHAVNNLYSALFP